MVTAPLVDDDRRRVAALGRYEIDDAVPGGPYDAVVELVAAVCATPAALVTVIDESRQFCLAAIGFERGYSARATSLCAYTIARPGEMLVIPDALADARFHDHPKVVGPPFVRFYAGAPLVSHDGFALGSVCTLDTVPRVLDEPQRHMLQLAARTVVALLEERRTSLGLERALLAQQSIQRRLDLLEAVAVHASDGIVVVATPPTAAVPPEIVYANAAFERLADATAGNPRDPARVRMLFAEAATFDAVARALQGREPFATETRVPRRDGTGALVEVRLWPVAVKPDGVPAYWVMLFGDISDRRRAEVENVRADAMSLANAELERELERRRNVERHLSFAAHHDALTGLPNRMFFADRLRARLGAGRGRFAVMFIDIDDFKNVNDTHGHLRGDDVLVTISRRLQHCVRAHDVVARLGGDEFTALIDDFEGLDDLEHLAGRLLEAVRRPCCVGDADDADVAVSVSVGIVVVDATYGAVDAVLRDADAAMFAAKDAGKDRFAFFDSRDAADPANAKSPWAGASNDAL